MLNLLVHSGHLRPPARPTWKRVLYLHQPYPDNYVDRSFLESLVLNANVRRYEYLPLCLGATRVAQQLGLVVAFLSIWSRVERGAWRHHALLLLDACLLALGYGLRLLLRRGEELSWRLVSRDGWFGLRVMAPLWMAAPMLQTLTRSWSDDTIISMTFCLLAVHVALHDYAAPPPMVGGGEAAPQSCGAARLGPTLPGGAVAINAAVFAATILASRLETADDVLAFMSLAMELFAFLPRLAATARQQAPRASELVLTPVMVLSAMYLLGGGRAAGVLFFTLAAVVFLAPAMLIRTQRYKAEIQGPWDLAHVALAESK